MPADGDASPSTPEQGRQYSDLDILALAQQAGGSPSDITARATAYKKWMEDQ